MSESGRRPQRRGGAVDRAAQIAEHLEDKSPEEILNELEAGMDGMTDLSYDEAVIDVYLAALEKKAPLNGELDVEQSWAAFRSQHAILFEPGGDPSAERGGAGHGRRHVRKVLLRLVSAAVLVGVLCLFCAQAAGFDVFGAIGRWTEETFRFEPEPARTGAAQEESTPYATLQDALDAYGISEALVPTWVPEGYEVQRVGVAPFSDQIIFYISFNNGKRDLAFSCIYWTEERYMSLTYEKDVTPVRLYEQAGITHYILSNENVLVATWLNAPYECMIFGNLTEAELGQIIDSIYI